MVIFMKKKRNCILSVILCVIMIMSISSVAIAEMPTINDVHMEMDALWEQMVAEAEAAVTPEQIAEIEKQMVEEENFFSNLTPYTLWEVFIEDNPEVLESRAAIRDVWQEIEKLYDYMISTSSVMPISPMSNSPLTGGIESYTRALSQADGLTNLVVRSAIEASAATAATTARSIYPNNRWRQDAFRHYLWNFTAVQNTLVGITQNGRVNSARIYTTNRELATNIMRRTPSLNVSNPNANQRVTMVNLRNIILNSNFTMWESFFTTAGGREDLMDLWNNEKGRIDGLIFSGRGAHPAFVNRWNANTLIEVIVQLM